MAGERTEQASPQRRDKARKDGDIVHSRELCSAAGTLAGVMLLGVAGPRFLAGWTKSLSSFMAYGAVSAWESKTSDDTMHALLSLCMTVLAPVALVAAGVTGASLAAGILQTGGIQIHPQSLGLKIDRINPLSNIKNLFSLRSTARLAKSMIPAAVLAVFAVQRIARQWDMPPFSSVRMLTLGSDVYELLMATSWLLFAWAAVDYLVEWRSREQRLKMSKQDMRDEYKESEGNPQIRGRIRNLQRQSRKRRMKEDISKAAVVITNPTHYAVALQFDFETMDAPKVLTKGRNLLAQEIKEQARWAGVPILENPPLARSLYRSVEAGDAIPVALYAAVASILAFLYRQRVEQEMRARRDRANAGQGAQAAQNAAARNGAGASASTMPPAVIPGSGPRRARGGADGKPGSGSGAAARPGQAGTVARPTPSPSSREIRSGARSAVSNSTNDAGTKSATKPATDPATKAAGVAATPARLGANSSSRSDSMQDSNPQIATRGDQL
jgi:flagellar biosynthetic protein FlhB